MSRKRLNNQFNAKGYRYECNTVRENNTFIKVADFSLLKYQKYKAVLVYIACAVIGAWTTKNSEEAQCNLYNLLFTSSPDQGVSSDFLFFAYVDSPVHWKFFFCSARQNGCWLCPRNLCCFMFARLYQWFKNSRDTFFFIFSNLLSLTPSKIQLLATAEKIRSD